MPRPARKSTSSTGKGAAAEADKGAEQDRMKRERQKKRSENNEISTSDSPPCPPPPRPPVAEDTTTEETTTSPDGRVVTKKTTATRYHRPTTVDPPSYEESRQQATGTGTGDPEAMYLMVKPSTTLQSTRLAVPPYATVGQLKDIIQEKLGIPKDHQNLVEAAREQRMSPRQSPLNSFGVVNGSAVHCVVLTDPVELNIDVSCTKKCFGFQEDGTPIPPVITFDVDETFLVREVKKLLYDYFHASPRYQKLYHRETELIDGDALSKYSLGPTATLRLEIFFERNSDGQDPLYIKTLNSKMILLRFDPDDEVGDIKQRIRQEEGIPSDQQRLIFAGKQLEDGHTVEEYGIRRAARIHLVLRLRGC